MDAIRNLYPGILEVEYFDSSLLSIMGDADSVFAEIPEDRMSIPLIEPGTCEVQKKDGAESITLKFCAQVKINPRFRPAFLIKDANGGSWLIASNSKPYPRMAMISTSGAMPDQRPQVSYEITHTAINTPIRVLVAST